MARRNLKGRWSNPGTPDMVLYSTYVRKIRSLEKSIERLSDKISNSCKVLGIKIDFIIEHLELVDEWLDPIDGSSKLTENGNLEKSYKKERKA